MRKYICSKGQQEGAISCFDLNSDSTCECDGEACDNQRYVRAEVALRYARMLARSVWKIEIKAQQAAQREA